MMNDLWTLYQKTFFQFESELPTSDDFAIVTAVNPRSTPLPKTLNDKRQRELKAQLRANGHSFCCLNAGDRQFDYFEPSIAVTCTQPEALALCLHFEQNAFYWVEDGQLWLVPSLLNQYTELRIGNWLDYLIPQQGQ